ncbi:hypothetical protein P167DRAFT_550126 [Morchella conica CCBAS932]|uniref:Uncharacterized protein n=1 Tax=Morchella conica CCBAS932 TaxID=1392247 RepID=A0A3N4K961_9PEZI|nr:hypothetical protein P167DRAFT_550126 [Morchella conica CCBAS932]
MAEKVEMNYIVRKPRSLLNHPSSPSLPSTRQQCYTDGILLQEVKDTKDQVTPSNSNHSGARINFHSNPWKLDGLGDGGGGLDRLGRGGGGGLDDSDGGERGGGAVPVVVEEVCGKIAENGDAGRRGGAISVVVEDEECDNVVEIVDGGRRGNDGSCVVMVMVVVVVLRDGGGGGGGGGGVGGGGGGGGNGDCVDDDDNDANGDGGDVGDDIDGDDFGGDSFTIDIVMAIIDSSLLGSKMPLSERKISIRICIYTYPYGYRKEDQTYMDPNPQCKIHPDKTRCSSGTRRYGIHTPNLLTCDILLDQPRFGELQYIRWHRAGWLLEERGAFEQKTNTGTVVVNGIE